MIRRYDFGRPIDTGAVVRQLPVRTGELPYFTVTEEDGVVRFTCALGADDMIFGLGESLGGVNKRGSFYRAWNSDEPIQTEDKRSLYGSHNLLLFSGEAGVYGAYFDDPGEMYFDLGYTQVNEAVVTSLGGHLSVYILEGDSLTELCRAFRALIGRSYAPPKWAMGYIQSRWGYASEAEISAVVQEHRSRHIPLDGVCMDIDYMDGYKNFTWNREAFPDLPAFTAAMRGEHVRLIPIIDAGVKHEEGYSVCDEGLAEDYFVKTEAGETFIGAVWPGHACFPDFMREDVRRWFGSQYSGLLEAGVEGFWNDMNEPALFYTPETLDKACAMAEALRHDNLDVTKIFGLRDAFKNVSNNIEDYRRFYHEVDGEQMRHDQVHNLYGAMMTRATADGLRAYNPSKRHLLFSRSSFVGAHRDGGVWQGDNCSWWSHLLLNLKMLPGLNMCGFLYTGADIGGFGCDTSEELLLRWLQLGVFTPLMRNHSAQGTRPQEAYRFAGWPQMRDVLTVRYGLLPYLYSTLMKNVLTDGMMFRPLAFDYSQDAVACRVEDQMMLGEECMIAPVYEPNARGRHVYLPEDMLLVRFRSAENYDLVKLEKGHHWIELATHELPLFIRRGWAIPMARGAEYVEAVDAQRLTLLGWIDGNIALTLYDDDGVSAAVELERNLSNITVTVDEGKAVVYAGDRVVDAQQVLIG